MSEAQLTQKQQYWLVHVKQASTEEISLAAYAKQHDLNLKLFYNMRAILRQKGFLPQIPSLLVPANISEPYQEPTPCRICLPNGVVIELAVSGSGAEFTQLLTCASQL